MTFRQKLLKTLYPAFMWITKSTGKNSTVLSTNTTKAMQSFYTLSDTLNNNTAFNFENLKGKKVLLVNTASDCGYTNQYNDLQKLSELYKDKLVVLGFPANDFKEQEKGSDEEIAQFCKINFGVTFPLMKKSTVVKGVSQNNVFKWLSDANLNGWCNQPPTWNFSKYLVNENGELVKYFDPSISPLDNEFKSAIER
ncbi:MAG: glutathione peroxidase [Ferruginibacter sp.]|nr:glutathione peroxidase [Ferruginibacter sp.]